MRTIIDLPEPMVQPLDAIRSHEKKSRAAIIREALQSYLAGRTAMEDQSFGLWKDEPLGGLAHQKKMRDEWSAS